MPLVVERTFAWLNQFGRLRVRYEKRADMHEALLALACALLCWNILERYSGKASWVNRLSSYLNYTNVDQSVFAAPPRGSLLMAQLRPPRFLGH